MRRLLTGIVVVAAAVALSAPVVGQDEAPLEPATLKVWIPFGSSEAPFVQAVIDDFAAMHPELTIEVTHRRDRRPDHRGPARRRLA